MSTELQRQAGRDYFNLKCKNNVLREKSVLQCLRANPGSTSEDVTKSTGVSVGNLRSKFISRMRSGGVVYYSVNEEAVRQFIDAL